MLRIAADPMLLWQNLVPTFIESILGFIIGNLAAVILGVAFVYNKRVEQAYFPVVLFLNTIPVLAIAPIIVLIFGVGILPKVIIASIICFFPTLVNMTRGLESVSASEKELMHVLSASAFEIFWKLRAPRSLPFLFASLRHRLYRLRGRRHRRRVDRRKQRDLAPSSFSRPSTTGPTFSTLRSSSLRRLRSRFFSLSRRWKDASSIINREISVSFKGRIHAEASRQAPHATVEASRRDPRGDHVRAYSRGHHHRKVQTRRAACS